MAEFKLKRWHMIDACEDAVRVTYIVVDGDGVQHTRDDWFGLCWLMEHALKSDLDQIVRDSIENEERIAEEVQQ
jgi:hypothetical protein